jgi:multicomponent Na+:H+ antiporter subunit G
MLTLPSYPEFMAALTMLVGTFLTVVACVGLVRFPDVYCRMHASGKAGTLGVSLLVVAAIIHFAETALSVPFRGALAIFFQFLTTPAATHLLARASYVSDYELDERTAVDDLKAFLPSRPHDTYGHE